MAFWAGQQTWLAVSRRSPLAMSWTWPGRSFFGVTAFGFVVVGMVFSCLYSAGSGIRITCFAPGCRSLDCRGLGDRSGGAAVPERIEGRCDDRPG
jgi:hypothetical protein